jgi:hypothetical protein
MQTLYLIVFTVLGGLLSLFAAAGWGSYKEKKIPGTTTLFQWFVTGVLGSGLASYAWIFGAGGDPGALIEKVGDALEVKEVVETLTSAVGTGAVAAAEKAAETAVETLTVGMPSF